MMIVFSKLMLISSRFKLYRSSRLLLLACEVFVASSSHYALGSEAVKVDLRTKY